MRRPIAILLTGALALAGCSKKAPVLPTDPIDRAAACGAVQAASEQEAIGAAGHLSAAAQERVLHYALLAGAANGRFAPDTASAVTRRTIDLFDRTTKGKWRTLKPACAAAFPPVTESRPTLPKAADERALQCYVLTDFMRKALGQHEGRYNEAAVELGVLADKLDAKVGPEVKRRGLAGQALTDLKDDALSAAAKLGQPPAVLAACGAAFDK